MRCFTWHNSQVFSGIALTSDARLGQVIFLGEEGRGRRYEKVALARRNPAEVVDGRVNEARPVKITLPPKDGRPEKIFFVLEKSSAVDQAVLVRVDTHGVYTRNSQGGWAVLKGSPELLVAGSGARGDAGRIGGWVDGLLILRPGDVLRVKQEGGFKTASFALWVEEDGQVATASLQDYENLQAVAKAEDVLAEAEGEPEALDMAFGLMPCFTYAGRGEIRTGLEVGKGATGPAVLLGEEGRGRKLTEVPIVGFVPGESVSEAAVAKLAEKKIRRSSWGQETDTVVTYGLTQSEAYEDAILVRVAVNRSPHRQYMRTEVLCGQPTKLAEGNYASGIAGFAGSVDDTLWVIRPSEAVVVRNSEDNLRVLENHGQKLISTRWQEWEIADGLANPAAYVAKGKAPWGHTPAEWIGRVVQVQAWVGEWEERERKTLNYLRRIHEGELISISPFVVNLGWDGRDRQDAVIETAVWVIIQPDKEVRHPEGADLQAREQAKDEIARLQAEAAQLASVAYFGSFEPELRQRIGWVVNGVSSWGNNLDFTLMITGDIQDWTKWASAVMSEARAASVAAQELATVQSAGEVLAEFGGHFRRMGKSGQCDFWVVRPDGSLRDPDSVEYRKRYTSEGRKQWKMVAPDELALVWSDGDNCNVAKAPVGGYTPAQLETVKGIEQELGAKPGSFGLDQSLNAERESASAEEADEPKAQGGEVNTDDLDALRQKWGAV